MEKFYTSPHLRKCVWGTVLAVLSQGNGNMKLTTHLNKMYITGKLLSFYGLYSMQLVSRGWAFVIHNKTLGSIKK
jgi:hypothetical protein